MKLDRFLGLRQSLDNQKQIVNVGGAGRLIIDRRHVVLDPRYQAALGWRK